MEGTTFEEVYNIFLSKVTDDMFLELSEEETQMILDQLIVSAIPHFEFPRVSLDYEIADKTFNATLTTEEMNIIAVYMVVEWLGQQLASVENTRMKYSGTDFKFTSQANHMKQLNALMTNYTTQGFHLQRLYKRRKPGADGVYKTTMSQIMEAEV